MRVLVIIHKNLKGWNYDVLYKLSKRDKELIKKAEELLSEVNSKFPILKVAKVDPLEDGYEYYAHSCPYVKEYMEKGWEYWGSGDTFHIPEILAAMGLQDEEDLKGLIEYVKKRFKPSMIVIKTKRGDGSESTRVLSPKLS